jgi:hypothetical protein
MGMTGSDVVLSEAAAKVFPFDIECKNKEKLNIWAALDQASQDNRALASLVVFKRNRSKVYVAMELDELMKILEEKKKAEHDLQVMIEDAAGESI